MDLNLTPDELQFRDELRSWLATNVPKDWNEWREKPIEESFPYLRAWQRKLQEGRWAAVSWPKEYAGRSATLMQQAIFWEEMARAEAPPMANSLGLGLIGPTIIAYGTEAQKQRFIPKILALKKSGARVFPSQTPAPISPACKRKHPPRRSLCCQRPKSLDQLRLGRRLVRARRAHRPHRREA